MTAIIIFLIVISGLIFIHELGHFLVAKWAGVRVEEFAIGMGPRLLTFGQPDKTIYTINLLPIGGYVRLLGEDNLTNVDDKTRTQAFVNKSVGVRALILSGGVIMNYLLGIVLIGLVLVQVGEPQVTTSIQITNVVSESPAEQAGLEEGVFITAFGTSEPSELSAITSSESFIEFIDNYRGQIIRIQTTDAEMTADSTRTVELIPRVSPPPGQGALGISLTEIPVINYQPVTWHQIPTRSVIISANLVLQMGSEFSKMIGDLFTQGVVPQDLAGPIGIAKLTGEVAQQGFAPLLQFVALISINLAFLNILPFPALDGGRIAFLLPELILGRRVSPQYEGWVHLVGLIILLILIALISYYDYLRFF